MAARVSVVVPVYNVAPYLDTCLESLAQQSFGDIEVVMVDDGSTDASAEIAERFAARDSRFRLVQQANAGLGAARNTGARHASGEFLAFVDSDDAVPRHAYEHLLEALDASGSDFASGNVRRFTAAGTQRTAFQSRAFERTRLGTHITRYPALLADRTAWNKLFRRSFWDEHSLRFPVGVLYEDIPVTIPAHYLAKSVDAVEQTVYLWRMRAGADLSITQRRTGTKPLRDRVAAVDHVSRFLGEQGFKVSKAAYDRTVLANDLRFFLDVLPRADDEYRRLFLDLANEFIDRADSWALDQPQAIDRLKWELVRRRALPELLEVLRFEEEDLPDVPPVRVGRRWYGDYPYRNDGQLNIPARTYRLDGELSTVFKLNTVSWEGEVLRIEGYAYINLIGAPSPDTQRVELVARRRSLLRRRMRLATEPVHRPDVTSNAAQQIAGLDWSGFVAKLDLAQLKRNGRLQEGIWGIGAVITSAGVTRSSWKPDAASLHPAPLAELVLDDGTRVRAGLGPTGRLTVEVQRRRSVVASCELDDGVLRLQGELGFGAGSQPELHVTRRLGGETLSYPLYVDRHSRPATFLAHLPIEDVFKELDVGDQVGRVEQSDGVSWDLSLALGGGLRPLALDDALPESTWTLAGREVVLQRTPEGGICLTEGALRPVVTAVEWSPEGTLSLVGSFRGPRGDYDLVLTAPTRETVSIPLAYAAEAGRFEAKVTPTAVPSPVGQRTLPEGAWKLSLGRRGESCDRGIPAVFARELLDELPVSAENGLRRFRLGVRDGDSVVLVAEGDLRDDERGGFNQRRLRTSFYPAKRALDLRDAVVYYSFGGREYSDSPRAIHEELVRRGAPLEHLWVVRDQAFGAPENAIGLRHGSREYYDAVARARYVVANDYWPSWFLRRPDQTCVQTWHGFPLKVSGYSLAEQPAALRAYRRVLGQKPENWQYVVSPAPAATPILEHAFPVGSEVLETGLPRTDRLHRPDRDRLAEDVKRRLGVEGKRVVLYAPTYRDHLHNRLGRRPSQFRDLTTYSASRKQDGYRLGPMLDLAALRSALGDDDVILFHRHRRIVDALPSNLDLFDVSGLLPDPGELVLAADVLITDYSAVLVDFACTGRPIVLFTPDFEDYRDEIRGFSIDFEDEAPAPLLRTTAEVVGALRDLEAFAAAHRGRYDRFVDAYCSLSDGGASSRVVDRVFSW
jgi:CDP-glycerol glycerophosphotransferase